MLQVGVLIGKSGDTIKYLQLNSGAKIQITRDADADPRAATRPVELVGTLESLNKAERLIKDVIAEVLFVTPTCFFPLPDILIYCRYILCSIILRFLFACNFLVVRLYVY